MIAKVKEFYTGLGLMIGFVIVLVLFFLPFYEGKNALDYLDNLYNSISKGSAYYIPKVKEETARFNGNMVNTTLATSSPKQAETDSPPSQGGWGGCNCERNTDPGCRRSW